MKSQALIRSAQSCAVDARAAAREFHRAVAQPEMALVLFFCSPDYDLDELAGELERLFAGVEVLGCTTAGEIGPAGYREHSISGASFAAGGFIAASGRIDGLQRFEIARGRALAQDVLTRLAARGTQADASSSFGFLLIDGMSVREEPVTRVLQSALGRVALVGGSAGDGLRFGSTYVYSDGAFRSDRAVLVVVSTSLPFRTFKTQHFVPTDRRVVVTGADPEHRVVSEIDGRPAADGYARLVGATVEGLDPNCFASRPLVVLIGGANYVRSIQQANADGSLTFFCAIEEGVVLRAARGGDLVEDLERTLAGLRDTIGEVQLVLGCDCILRRLEVVQSGMRERVEALVREHNVVGFNSYGEQYCGVHVNQTLTGVAIGRPADG
ncbi:MAG: nitric oxide-sensing protein NosP [Solirubrobacteraceae bacterium]